MPVALIGSAIAWGSGRRLAEAGPARLRDWGLDRRLAGLGVAAHWHAHVAAAPSLAERGPAEPAETVPWVVAHCHRLAAAVAEAGGLPVTLGGDHSSAIGHYAGLKRRLGPGARLGLVWIDAHPDLNTHDTSPSQACHGMALAAALGHGRDELLAVAGGASLDLSAVALVGARSIDPGERDFIIRHGIRVFGMDDIARHGLTAVLDQAVAIAGTGTDGYGLTIDLDGLDPEDAPGVGFPEPGGVRAAELLPALRRLTGARAPAAVEIVEYEPALDVADRTAELVLALIAALAGGAPA